MIGSHALFPFLVLAALPWTVALIPAHLSSRCPLTTLLHQSSTTTGANGSEGPLFDTPLQPTGLEGLFQAAALTAIPRGAETAKGAHDAFRYEWGRWIDEASMEELMERINEIQLIAGVYDTLVVDDDNDESSVVPPSRRLRVAGGEYWDCILHILPQDAEWKGRWPTGAWAVVRALTGVAEIAMLRGPNRDGFYTKATKKALRGGGDGTLAGGSAGGGEDCVKYVGGALRSYSGKSGKTTLLEVVVRPPIGKEQLDGDGQDSTAMKPLESPDSFLTVAVPGSEETEEEEEEGATSDPSNGNASNLGAKMGMSFDKVGGLDDQLNAIVRRVLASRYVRSYCHFECRGGLQSTSHSISVPCFFLCHSVLTPKPQRDSESVMCAEFFYQVLLGVEKPCWQENCRECWEPESRKS
jgi:hypothetical protein